MGACDEKVEYTLLNPLGYFTYQAEYQVGLTLDAYFLEDEYRKAEEQRRTLS